MPITGVAQPDGRATLTFQDPYTFAEWASAMQSLLAIGRPLRLIVDRRTASPPPREFVDRMVQFMVQHASDVKSWRAAVVTASEVAYGMSRMLEMSAESREVAMTIRTFRSYEEAERWLGTAP